jgi:hypothetical protein
MLPDSAVEDSVTEVKMCACGKPLHYTDPQMQKLVEYQIAQLGENMVVTLAETGRKFRVPRHFIALHGLKGKELPTLGFTEL